MEQEPSRLSNSPRAPTLSLPAEINAASRTKHHELNRLIIERLPLALPPSASDPALYGRGIATFAEIYFTFEKVWTGYIDSPGEPRDGDKESREAQLRRWLSALRPAGLARSDRLRQDIQYILGRTGSDIERSSRARDAIILRMRRSLLERPHTLVAYAWVMYMAIFSGGRWIRKQLHQAGPDFWLGSEVTRSTEQHTDEKGVDPHELLRGHSFLSFDGEDDGEDIKVAFKSRLAQAETLLSNQEREDVVQAAVELFEDCIALVGILDRDVWWQTVRLRLFCAALFVPGIMVIALLWWLDIRKAAI